MLQRRLEKENILGNICDNLITHSWILQLWQAQENCRWLWQQVSTPWQGILYVHTESYNRLTHGSPRSHTVAQVKLDILVAR